MHQKSSTRTVSAKQDETLAQAAQMSPPVNNIISGVFDLHRLLSLTSWDRGWNEALASGGWSNGEQTMLGVATYADWPPSRNNRPEVSADRSCRIRVITDCFGEFPMEVYESSKGEEIMLRIQDILPGHIPFNPNGLWRSTTPVLSHTILGELSPAINRDEVFRYKGHGLAGGGHRQGEPRAPSSANPGGRWCNQEGCGGEAVYYPWPHQEDHPGPRCEHCAPGNLLASICTGCKDPSCRPVRGIDHGMGLCAKGDCFHYAIPRTAATEEEDTRGPRCELCEPPEEESHSLGASTDRVTTEALHLCRRCLLPHCKPYQGTDIGLELCEAGSCNHYAVRHPDRPQEDDHESPRCELCAPLRHDHAVQEDERTGGSRETSPPCPARGGRQDTYGGGAESSRQIRGYQLDFSACSTVIRRVFETRQNAVEDIGRDSDAAILRQGLHGWLLQTRSGGKVTAASTPTRT